MHDLVPATAAAVEDVLGHGFEHDVVELRRKLLGELPDDGARRLVSPNSMPLPGRGGTRRAGRSPGTTPAARVRPGPPGRRRSRGCGRDSPAPRVRVDSPAILRQHRRDVCRAVRTAAVGFSSSCSARARKARAGRSAGRRRRPCAGRHRGRRRPRAQ
jgi:hypothetical protein